MFPSLLHSFAFYFNYHSSLWSVPQALGLFAILEASLPTPSQFPLSSNPPLPFELLFHSFLIFSTNIGIIQRLRAQDLKSQMDLNLSSPIYWVCDFEQVNYLKL